MNKFLKTTIVAALLMGFVSCSKVPISNRRQLNMLPEMTLMSLSLTNYNQFFDQNPRLPDNREEVKMVRKVGNRIAVACDKFLKIEGKSKRIKNFRWEFNVVDQPVVNAWCMPGGKVCVYTGLLPVTLDEDGLAVVMSHEIAHAIARHGNERMSQRLVAVLGGVSIAVALRDKPQETQLLFLAAYGVGAGLTILAYSRQHETEADKLGLCFMAKAGYNPEAAVPFWERMKGSGGSNIPQFISTHPSHDKRINDLTDFMPVALSYYEAYSGE